MDPTFPIMQLNSIFLTLSKFFLGGVQKCSNSDSPEMTLFLSMSRFTLIIIRVITEDIVQLISQAEQCYGYRQFLKSLARAL